MPRIRFVCCWANGKKGTMVLGVLRGCFSFPHVAELLGVFPSWFMLSPHCSIPKNSFVCCSVVREPRFPVLWVNGGRFCSCYAQKRFLSSYVQFRGLWWSSMLPYRPRMTPRIIFSHPRLFFPICHFCLWLPNISLQPRACIMLGRASLCWLGWVSPRNPYVVGLFP